MKKMIIPGGSGFLGLYLARYLSLRGWESIILSRKETESEYDNIRYVQWDGKTLGDWKKEFEGADAVVNMAGRTVNCRYTEENKRQIMDSRVDSTKVLGEAIAACQNPPKLWVNSSTATIYKDTRGDQPANDEYNGVLGDDFSMNVAKTWEKTFNEAKVQSSVRKVALRTAIVLGRDGGAMGPILNLVSVGLGGKQGPGTQWVSWVHVEDFSRIIEFLVEKEEVEGIINCAAPNPELNKNFMRKLRYVYRRWFGFPLPTFLLKFGAILIRTEVELVLKSRKAVSKRLAELGFEFKYKKVEDAFEQIV
ncbi:MAG: TIGR01777 family protein [Aureispira sp.]|nr:TIGR01777 family protein [Aureispira sp.]